MLTKIQFGKLKTDIKDNFYLGGSERQVENQTCYITGFNDTYPNRMFVQLENNSTSYYVDIDKFEHYEIIGG